jgi:hypothetical protein
MKVSEIINELTFHGSQCTKDCSGHRAGWYWSKVKQLANAGDCNSHSASFNKGCAISIAQRSQGKNPIAPSVRGEKGRFVKYAGRK